MSSGEYYYWVTSVPNVYYSQGREFDGIYEDPLDAYAHMAIVNRNKQYQRISTMKIKKEKVERTPRLSRMLAMAKNEIRSLNLTAEQKETHARSIGTVWYNKGRVRWNYERPYGTKKKKQRYNMNGFDLAARLKKMNSFVNKAHLCVFEMPKDNISDEE